MDNDVWELFVRVARVVVIAILVLVFLAGGFAAMSLFGGSEPGNTEAPASED
jgi:hypothetical protein